MFRLKLCATSALVLWFNACFHHVFFYRVYSQHIYFFWFTGCKNKNHGALLKELMQTSNFRVTVVEEYDVVEICGALKVSSQCRICLLATRLQNMDCHLDFNTGLFMVSRTNDYFCTLSKSHTKQSRGILSLVPVPVSHA